MPRRLLLPLLLTSPFLGACGDDEPKTTGSPAGRDPARKELTQIARSEATIAMLGTNFKEFSQSIRNLSFPDLKTRANLRPEIEVLDLAAQPDAPTAQDFANGMLGKQSWSAAAKSQTVEQERFQLWQAFLSQVDYFDFAKVYPISGVFEGERFRTYKVLSGFSANAKLLDGRRVTVSAKQYVTFKLNEDVVKWNDLVEKPSDQPAVGAKQSAGSYPVISKADWKLSAWKTKSFKVIESDQLLFDDAMPRALPTAELQSLAQRSQYEELILKYYDEGELNPPPSFEINSQDRHPGLAVVDIDGDGFDDLYLMVRLGQNLLFQNQGDGTFKETSRQWGLDIAGDCSSAAFVDFDNDGDPDLALGRTLAPSQLYLNDGKRFSLQNDLVKGRLPSLVSSVAAADVDGDGLIDLYFSTYAAGLVNRALGLDTSAVWTPDTRDLPSQPLLSEHLDPQHAAVLTKKYTEVVSSLLDRHGPPNILLRNVGGSFQVEKDDSMHVYRNSFQSTFADYDNDGDADIYVANDFAPNYLLENDGTGKFKDVTPQYQCQDNGFGMGASFGDYDNNGMLDLYVSNMFSKAGQRIIGQAGKLDLNPLMKRGAEGNSLFENLGESMLRSSGTTPEAMHVEHAGWSWGSQFIDFNNDGHLDILAPCGYYSAPARIATAVDL
jgi:hypothetical protein